jgi:hypothetical protein
MLLLVPRRPTKAMLEAPCYEALCGRCKQRVEKHDRGRVQESTGNSAAGSG